MDEASIAAEITIRPAVAGDADGITRTYMESAEYHAGQDPERYWVPAAEAIAARYREGRQHPPSTTREAITLVAEIERPLKQTKLEARAEPAEGVGGYAIAHAPLIEFARARVCREVLQ